MGESQHRTNIRHTLGASHVVCCVGAHPLSAYLSNDCLFSSYYMPDSSGVRDTVMNRTDENAYPQGTYILANETAFIPKVTVLCQALL